MNKYTHHNGALNSRHLGERVSLRGWVHKKRNLGGLIFIDLRDKEGITQLVVRPKSPLYQIANQVKNEYVIEIEGMVVLRESKNKHLPTGEIEVELTHLTIVNKAQATPILISELENLNEEVKLKYRYLDLRKPSSQNYIITRSKITQVIRNTLLNKQFLELETPYLVKTTPEGAKEFLVPSRIYHGEAYALAQSPQMFKQLYMIAGFDKYFQMARCFRDEDLRADRQLEFTQVDIEASFVDQEDIIALTEEMMKNIFESVLHKTLPTPFLSMSFKDAFHTYGSDKPDLRFELPIQDFKAALGGYDIPLFEDAAVIRGFKVKSDPIFTRKYIDSLTEIVKQNHGKALAYVKLEAGKLSGSIAKFVDESLLNDNEVLFLIPGEYEDATHACGALRKALGEALGLIDESKDVLLWVTDFPLLEYNEEDQRFYAKHHPFTAPKLVDDLKNNPKSALAQAYDLVWNGYEVGGGSMRIYDEQTQKLMFETLGFNAEELNRKFGFFIEALSYGTPPHGGIALGLDRIVMLATKTTNIKDVVAFPKTQSARDLMMQAPSVADEKQWDELGLKVIK